MAIVFFLLAGTAQMLCYSFLLKQKADLHQISADLVSRRLRFLRASSRGMKPCLPEFTRRQFRTATRAGLFSSGG